MSRESVVEAPNLSALLNREDSGKWVALAPDYSAAWARAESVTSLLEALSEAERAQGPVFYRVPNADTY
jgi:flagellin-like hook-associated protein FlgL